MSDPIGVAPGVWVTWDVRGRAGAPTIVLLPPLGGSGALFEPFREALAEDHEVVTVEPPGSGDAAAPAGVPGTRALASHVVAALDRLGLARAHLFGISLGGMVAQWIAVEHPRRVDRLILASTAARGLAAVGLSARQLAIARALLLPDPAVQLAQAVISDDTLEDPGEKQRIEEAAATHARSRTELLWLGAAAAAHDTTIELARIVAPTLVLTGDADDLIPHDAQRELAAAIPGALHHLVEGSGHDLTIDQPQRTAEEVRAFLRDSGAGGDRA